jgi:hypothetical protein
MEEGEDGQQRVIEVVGDQLLAMSLIFLLYPGGRVGLLPVFKHHDVVCLISVEICLDNKGHVTRLYLFLMTEDIILIIGNPLVCREHESHDR